MPNMCKLGNLCAPDAHPSEKSARMLRLPVLRAVLGCICCLVGSGALVASIPFFLEVSPFLHVATELDAAESFERLNSSCRVLSIRRCWSSTPDALEPSAPQSERDPAATYATAHERDDYHNKAGGHQRQRRRGRRRWRWQF